MVRIRLSIFFSVFVAMVGLMIIAPVMPPLIRELGLSETHSGLIISLGSIAMAVMAPVWGRRSDLLGRKPVILIGFLGMFVSYILFTLVMYAGLSKWISGTLLVVLLIVARAMVGLFIPAVPSSAQAYMADVTDEKGRSAGMALIGAANGLGLVLGPAIAGIFVLIGLMWPLYIGAALPLIAFVVVLLLIPAHKPVIRAKPPKVNPFAKGLRLYLFAGLATMLSIVTLQVIGGFYFQDQLALSTQETARMVSLGLIFSGVAMIITQRAADEKFEMAAKAAHPCWRFACACQYDYFSICYELHRFLYGFLYLRNRCGIDDAGLYGGSFPCSCARAAGRRRGYDCIGAGLVRCDRAYPEHDLISGG